MIRIQTPESQISSFRFDFYFSCHGVDEAKILYCNNGACMDTSSKNFVQTLEFAKQCNTTSNPVTMQYGVTGWDNTHDICVVDTDTSSVYACVRNGASDPFKSVTEKTSITTLTATEKSSTVFTTTALDTQASTATSSTLSLTSTITTTKTQYESCVYLQPPPDVSGLSTNGPPTQTSTLTSTTSTTGTNECSERNIPVVNAIHPKYGDTGTKVTIQGEWRTGPLFYATCSWITAGSYSYYAHYLPGTVDTTSGDITCEVPKLQTENGSAITWADGEYTTYVIVSVTHRATPSTPIDHALCASQLQPGHFANFTCVFYL